MENKIINTELLVMEQDQIITIGLENSDLDKNYFNPQNGYGACKADGCNCNGYKPNDPKNDYCRVCGHHWTRHW